MQVGSITFDRLYMVIVDFGDLGLGGGGDVTASREEAYDQYVAQVEEGRAARVLVINTQHGENSHTDETSSFHDEYERICVERGFQPMEAA